MSETTALIQTNKATPLSDIQESCTFSECLICQTSFKCSTGTDLDSLITKDTYCREVLADLLSISSDFEPLEADHNRICGSCLFQVIKYWEYHQLIQEIRQEIKSKFDFTRILNAPNPETVVDHNPKPGPEAILAESGVRLSGVWKSERLPVESPEFWRHLVGHDETKCDILLRTKILKGRYPNCLFLASSHEESPPKSRQGGSGESNVDKDGSWHLNEPRERLPRSIRKYCCANKTCGLALWTIIPQQQWNKDHMEQHVVELLIQGNSNHETWLDKSRTRFEMTRQEFIQDHVCEFCCEEFRNGANLDSHMRTHKENQAKDSVDQEDALIISRDMAIIYPKSPYTCPVGGCEKQFATFQSRNLHYLAIHTSDAPYKCKKCDKKFKVKLKFKDHIKKCILGQRHACDLCPKVFMSSRNLRDHLNVIHSAKQDNQEEKPFSCPRCPKRFHKRHNLKYHMVTHSAERAFTCTVLGCSKSFKRERALKSHMETLHADKKPSFLCVYCGRNFDSFTGMKTHTKLHTGEEYIKRKVSCPTCQKKFQCPSDLKIHSVVHTKEKPFVCHICQASFSQRASLKDHTNVHLNIYQCSHCLRSFGRERYLQSHLKTCHSPTKDDVRDEGRQNSDEPFDNVAQNRPVIPIESLLNGPAHDSSRHDRADSKKVQTRKNIPRSFITHEIEPVRENRPFQEPRLSSSSLSGKPLPFESDQYQMVGSHLSSVPGSMPQEILLVNQTQEDLPGSPPHRSLNITLNPQYGRPIIEASSSSLLSSSFSTSISSKSEPMRKTAPLNHPLAPTSSTLIAPTLPNHSSTTEVLVELPPGSGEITMIHYVEDEELHSRGKHSDFNP